MSYAANPAAYKARAKKWARENPEKRRAILQRYAASHPWHWRAAHWKRAGVDVTAAKATLAAHDGKCGICASPKPGGTKGWHVDHDHATGKVRGILCCGCNLRLGWYEKRRHAIDIYLRRYV